MKSIEFDESRLGDLNSLVAEMFGDASDPRSFGYKRILVRPKLNWFKIVLNCLIPLLLSVVLAVVLVKCGLPAVYAVLTCVGLMVVYMLLRAKAIIICLIHIYQHFAPDAVRNKCRFEPSCSRYMIQAIEKYGVVKGLRKGIDRLKRCNIDNGGFDFP